MSNPKATLPSLVDAVISAAESLEDERLETTCEALIAYLQRQPASPEPRVAKKVLGELRKWRHFGAMQRLADALIRLGCDAHVVYRQYAQALIDDGELIPALELLLGLAERAKDDSEEYSEACGLLGRVYKQIYTEAQSSRLGMAEAALARAIAYYRRIYDADPSKVWHGVNVVALLRRAKRDGIVVPDAPDPNLIAFLGRVYKQIYTEAQSSRLGMAEAALARAIAYYRRIYDADPSKVWHGVNVVALLRRAKRDGIVVPDAPDPNLIAEALAAHIAQHWTDDLPGWDYAAAAEACLALEDWTGAERWLQKYLSAKDVDAFAVAGTLRQFTEIWGLRADGSPGGELIPVLRAALLLHKHGRLDLTPAQVHRMHGAKANAFERILGDTGLQTHQWMCQGIERARAVAKIRQPDGRGVGTGFLVRGRELYAPLGDQLLLLTNAHVLSNDPAHRAAVSSDDAQISFEALAEPGRTAIRHRVNELVWKSAPDALDASLLRLDPPPTDAEPCPIANNLPIPDESQRVYVIGHPLGGELSFSLQDNRLLDHEGPPNGQPSRMDCLYQQLRFGRTGDAAHRAAHAR